MDVTVIQLSKLLVKEIACKGVELGHIFLLDANMKQYMENAPSPSDLTFGDIESHKLSKIA